MPEPDVTPHVGRSRLVDVANVAGVTKSVASRVLNNDKSLSVRDETRLRVLQAAQRLGYQPHAGAQALAGSRARSFALLIPDLTNPVYSRITRGAYFQARQRQYALLLAEDTADEAVEEQFADLIAGGRVDGLLIASARPDHPLLRALPTMGAPYVFLNRSVAGSNRNVTVDLEAASRRAGEHLIGLGHARIGHIAGPKELTLSMNRLEGLLSATRAVGLPDPVVAHGDFSEAGGSLAAEHLMQMHPQVTAIYASTLNQAIGALHGLRHMGIDVPSDVSVISYDDLPLADYLVPPLTTVAMPLVELGRAGVEALWHQLQGEPLGDVIVPSEPQIVVRASTAPPPAGSAKVGTD